MNKIAAEGWDFFKINFKWLLAASLFLILYMQGCFERFQPTQPTVTHDTTVIIHKYESEPYQPPVINVIPPKPTIINQPQYQADTSSIQNLRKQFDQLVLKHTEQNVYNDTIKVDTLGYVNVKDTISENKLASRSFNYNIKEKVITTTIREPYKPRNQLFVGGSFGVPINAPTFQTVDVGLLFKNKGDKMIGLSGTYDFKSNSPGFRVSYYNKIKFGK